MKKVLLCVVLSTLVFSMNVFGEVKKGDWLASIYSDLGFLRYETKYTNGVKEKGNEFYVDLLGEKFITDNISLGGRFSYCNDAVDWNGDWSYFAVSSSYFFQPEKKLNPYLNACLGFTNWNSTPKTSGEGPVIGCAFGTYYFINNNVAINGELTFRHYNLSDGLVDEQNRLNINFGFGIKL